MGSITLEVTLVFVLIIANGVFALAEVAIVASRKARLQQRAQEGDGAAKVALELAENPNRFLATVQIGITLVGIFAGAFGGATLSKEIAAWARSVPALAPYADSIGLGLVVVAITYFSLIIGELVPKRIGLHSPERIATLIARPMRALSILASPIVTLLSASTDGVLRLFGLRASEEPSVTEEEIKVMVEQGAHAGIFEHVESDMVGRVFRLGDRAVSSLMTRRPDVAWLNLLDAPDVNRRKLAQSVHSRLPVCRGSLDEPVGVVQAKSLLQAALESSEFDFTAAAQPPIFVPETLPALTLLERFKQGRAHLALVVDEFGSVCGVVTLHDILEAIVGDLPPTNEADEPQAVRRDDGSWLLDGMLPIEEFKVLFHLDTLPGEDSKAFQSMSGFVMMHMGRVPAASDHFEASGLRFEVVDMDGHRVDKLLVAPLPSTPAETAP